MLVVCLWFSVCAAETPGAWLDVPFVQQARNGCGAASISMVMQYWERQRAGAVIPGSQVQEIQRALYSENDGGIRAFDMARYFEQHQFRAFPFTGNWNDVRQHLHKGRPLIVALKPSRLGPLHYVVVAGLDETKKLILVNDPARRKLLQQDWSDFEKQWKGAGNWTLLAVPHTGAPSAP